MPTRLPMCDGELFIAKLEAAMEDNDCAFIEANMPRLEKLIAFYQDRSYELAKLQQRARVIRDRHEPPASRRITP